METAYTVLDPKAASTLRGLCALAVMIKAPRAGAVKTRLVPPLDHEEAARLSVCFLRDTALNIADVASIGAAEGVAVYTPVGAESAFDGLLHAGFNLVAQRGESFGERLFHAAEDLLALGYRSLCLIDSDSPTLPGSFLVDAVRWLAQPGDRIVLGPSDDGGYYLIGLKHAHARLFEDITWSTDQVLGQTIERARELELEISLLPAWFDVDDGATLGRLCDELFLPGPKDVRRDGFTGYEASHTRGFLARLIEMEGRGRIWPEGGAPVVAAS
ncbi:MAG: TIGR04282 family arsenosugar biosynthesis glycosyltransferase, partial [Acidobacteria bacterium]|nr:TIGR04282 family arsenosugar biosynthesis glycosyltransferase [Acidobacteriota bacterium]